MFTFLKISADGILEVRDGLSGPSQMHSQALSKRMQRGCFDFTLKRSHLNVAAI